MVGLVGIADGIPVEALMLVELGVLVIDDGGNELGRYILNWYPVVAYLQAAPLLPRLNMTLDHKRRERDGDELEEQDNAYRA